jgi:hypothetical protein
VVEFVTKYGFAKKGRTILHVREQKDAISRSENLCKKGAKRKNTNCVNDRGLGTNISEYCYFCTEKQEKRGRPIV